MSEYIKKEDVIKALQNAFDEIPMPYALAEGILKDVPSVDAVEVVRCKDCKHWQAKPNEDEEDNENNGFATWYDCDKTCHICGNGNDYCSYGERKDDDNA